MTNEKIIAGIKGLLPNMTNLANSGLTPEKHKLLADAYTFVQASGKKREEEDLRIAIDNLMDSTRGPTAHNKRSTAARTIQTILNRVVSMLEMDNPK